MARDRQRLTAHGEEVFHLSPPGTPSAGTEPDLFGRSAITGLTLSGDFISATEEPALTRHIDGAGLSPFRFQGWLGKRLTRSYGSGYDFDAGRLAVSEPIPDWLESTRDRAAGFAGLDPAELTQALLTRYDPGAGIGWHRDRPFYEHVIGISLGAPATLRFRRKSAKGFERIGIVLPSRSIYHLSGEARHLWEHGIAEMAQTRWSITFRSLSATGETALSRLPRR